jgi:hypothetical protein
VGSEEILVKMESGKGYLVTVQSMVFMGVSRFNLYRITGLQDGQGNDPRSCNRRASEILVMGYANFQVWYA